jgi:hypothetical protein
MLNNIVGLLGDGAPVVPNSFESIATALGTGSSNTITFTSIPSTYKHLQVRMVATPTSSVNLRGTFNNDTANNYVYHFLGGDGASTSAGNGSTALYMGYLFSTTTPSSAIIDVLDYTSASKNKTLRSLFGNDNNGSGWSLLTSSLWINSASAITTFTLYPQAGSFAQNSHFALYGIKG